MMKVPYVALDRAFKRHSDLYLKIIKDVWEAGQMYEGYYVKVLEQIIEENCSRKLGVAVASCTDALYFALLAEQIGAGDEVIVTSYSFVASASCIIRVGATPVFIDIDPDTFMVTADEIEKHITDKTRAIIAVNLFGQALPIMDIEKVAYKHSLVLIEDAAQSFGAFYENRAVGSMGNASCISFDPVKNLGSFGSGGMYVTDDPVNAMKVRAFRNHGRVPPSYEHNLQGIKSKMTTADAGVLLTKINHLWSENARRDDIAYTYISGLEDINEISLPTIIDGVLSVWHKFIIVVEDKAAMHNHLAVSGIEHKDTYPRPLYMEPIFAEYAHKKCPNAEAITKGNIALPIFPDMTDEEVEYVIATIRNFYS